MQRLALHNPCSREYSIGEEQESNSPLKCSAERFDARYTHEEEADGNFCPHQRSESLDPFSVGIFPELVKGMGGEELLVPSETVGGFHEVETSTNGVSYLDEQYVSKRYFVPERGQLSDGGRLPLPE